MIIPGVYRHWRGQRYLVLGVASWSGNRDWDPGMEVNDGRMVVYVSLEAEGRTAGPVMRVRPVGEFTEGVEGADGRVGPRFAYEGQEWHAGS